ncbi:hypothetical protein AB0M43_38915 [Longispora sp. NPDC051575]|uniref:hypothetical protein n=1 Tax=Longispora sp. NPDC051575 TaxID=3154943 RepID=UPI003414B658
MRIHWQRSAAIFGQLLRDHGVDSEAVNNVAAAWEAYCEFLQADVEGIDETPGSDADGFIVQWGRWSWNDERPSLSFTRQLAIIAGDQADADWLPILWQVELQLSFDHEPNLADLDALDTSDTGWCFSPVGHGRTAELAAMRTDMQRHRQLRAIWNTVPVSSHLSFECIC